MRVLLVEDCYDDALLTTQMLVDSGVQQADVVCVRSLAEALRFLHESEFDVIALDLHLPDSRGADSVSRLLQGGNGTPIVVLSGSEDAQTILAAVRAGARDYLIKQKYDPPRLMSVLEKAAAWNAKVSRLKQSIEQ